MPTAWPASPASATGFAAARAGFTRMGDAIAVGTDQIIRCDNDPSLPGNGSLQIIIEGGK